MQEKTEEEEKGVSPFVPNITNNFYAITVENATDSWKEPGLNKEYCWVIREEKGQVEH